MKRNSRPVGFIVCLGIVDLLHVDQRDVPERFVAQKKAGPTVLVRSQSIEIDVAARCIMRMEAFTARPHNLIGNRFAIQQNSKAKFFAKFEIVRILIECDLDRISELFLVIDSPLTSA